jgi:hypothetical protein
MKFIRYVFIMALLVIMIIAFTACGGNNNNTPTPTPNPTVAPTQAPDPTPPPATPTPTTPEQVAQPQQDELTADEVADYLAAMDEFIDAFEDLKDFVFELIDLLEELETDEELLVWIEAFEIVKNAVAESVVELDSASPYVPEEYLEGHLLIIASVSIFLDSMLELDVALAAAVAGDYDALWVGLEGFAVNLAVAFALWDEALYGPVTHAPILIGTWGLEGMPEWVWNFNEDGTGSGGVPSEMDSFVWETSNVFPWINAVGGELWIDFGANNIQHWEFVVELDHADHVLILESLQVEDIGFVYIRQ